MGMEPAYPEVPATEWLPYFLNECTICSNGFSLFHKCASSSSRYFVQVPYLCMDVSLSGWQSDPIFYDTGSAGSHCITFIAFPQVLSAQPQVVYLHFPAMHEISFE